MGFTGDLRGFSVPEFLQLLALGRKTGMVSIGGKDDPADGGRIALLQGRLMHAECPDGLQGVEAAARLFGRAEGVFHFDALEPEQFQGPKTIDRTLDSLLLELSQEMDPQ